MMKDATVIKVKLKELQEKYDSTVKKNRSELLDKEIEVEKLENENREFKERAEKQKNLMIKMSEYDTKVS